MLCNLMSDIITSITHSRQHKNLKGSYLLIETRHMENSLCIFFLPVTQAKINKQIKLKINSLALFSFLIFYASQPVFWIFIRIENKLIQDFPRIHYFRSTSANFFLVRTNGKCTPRRQSILILEAITTQGFRVSAVVDWWEKKVTLTKCCEL